MPGRHGQLFYFHIMYISASLTKSYSAEAVKSLTVSYFSYSYFVYFSAFNFRNIFIFHIISLSGFNRLSEFTAVQSCSYISKAFVAKKLSVSEHRNKEIVFKCIYLVNGKLISVKNIITLTVYITHTLL